MSNIIMDCGCEFETKNNIPIINYDLDKNNLNCPKIWDLISSGKTIGLFQIDSPLGQMMSHKLKPQNIDHLAGLIAIMRPSCLQGVLDDGKSIANHFIDRKNGIEKVVCQYKPLENILKNTFQLLIYQEQTIKIGQELAGMDLNTADELLRKGIGKKKADILTKAKKVFLEGCQKLGKVNDKEAQEIWSWIFSAARYQFNMSHSYEYAVTTIYTAIAKAHFPHRFFKSYLNHSTDKPHPLTEIKSLVRDARSFGIDVLNPDLRLKNPKFIEKDGQIIFGLQYIKGIGEKGVESIIRASDALDLNQASWPNLLFNLFLGLNKRSAKHIIATGCIDYLNISRERLLYEHDLVIKLTAKEIEWIKNNINLQESHSVESLINKMLHGDTGQNAAISNKNRKNIIKNLQLTLVKKPFSVIDSVSRICAIEESYLGTSIKFHKTDDTDKALADSTCKEIQDGKTGNLKIIVEILKVKESLTKKDKKRMCFVSGEDSTEILENIVLFEDTLIKFQNEIFVGNTVLFTGYISKFGTFVVRTCTSI